MHTCQGVPVSVETALLHHPLPTFMWDLGIKLRATGLCSKCLYSMCLLPCPPHPNLSFQAWLYNICWCKYLIMRYLKKGLWLLHRQKEGPSRACAALTFLLLIQNLGEGSAVPNFIILLTFSYFWIYRYLLFIFFLSECFLSSVMFKVS